MRSPDDACDEGGFDAESLWESSETWMDALLKVGGALRMPGWWPGGAPGNVEGV